MRVAIICGGAVGVWQERARAIELVAAAGHRAVYCAINDSGAEHPNPMHHWASLHPEKFEAVAPKWERLRVRNGHAPAYTRWSLSSGQSVDHVARTWRGGSSSLLAVDAMINGVGTDLAILCGCPMDARVNQFKGLAWAAAARFRAAWTTRAPEFRDRVRSLSGWTAQLLGVPDMDWLRGTEG